MRNRSVALITSDPSLYHELAGFLRERRISSVSLLPGDRIPDRVAVVLTSAEERGSIDHPNVLTVAEGVDRPALSAAIAQCLGAADTFETMVVGIDPGPRPGYAILVGGTCLGEGSLDGPEAAGVLAAQLRHWFPARHVVFRVGLGDPPARNRVVNSLLARQRTVELVNEDGTTPRGRRRPRDAVAARSIARSRGTPVRDVLTTSFTAGEISNLQRLSREGSGGRLTISRSSAHRVLRGELTLAEAVGQAMEGRVPRASPTTAPRPREPL